MNLYNTLLICRALLICCIFIGIPAQINAEAKGFVIRTTNYPLQYFAGRIVGKHAQVEFALPQEGDPAFWTPDAETILKLQQADLVLLNGAGYEKWLSRVSLSASRVIDTSVGISERLIREKGSVNHQHGPAGEHSHEGTAFTTWLNFELASFQAQAIFEAVSTRLPQHQKEFESNLNSLRTDLMNLHHEMSELGKVAEEKLLIASHPVYQYLSGGYDLNVLSLHWEPEQLPSDGEWSRLAGLLKKQPASVMLWEGEPLAASVKKLEDLGVRSIIFAPSGNVPDKGDFLVVMRSNIDQLKATLN